MIPEMAVPEPTPKVRRWPRYRLDLPVRVVVERGSKTVLVHGRGRELNEGGLAIFAGAELAVDERLAIEFTPPYNGQPVRARCVVRSRSGYNYGLEFLDDTAQNLNSADEIRSVLRGYGVMVR